MSGVNPTIPPFIMSTSIPPKNPVSIPERRPLINPTIQANIRIRLGATPPRLRYVVNTVVCNTYKIIIVKKLIINLLKIKHPIL